MLRVQKSAHRLAVQNKVFILKEHNAQNPEGKLQLSLHLIKYYGMKMWEWKYISTILELDTRQRLTINLMTQLLYP
jgi:hypothetical protein